MSKQKKKQKQSKSKNFPLIITAAVIVCAAVLVVVLKPGQGEETSSGDSGDGGVQVIHEGENLVIPAGEVTGTASFYPIEVDGTEMEVLAVKDSSGIIRTAFNTCQVCYDSGNGYYVQNGKELVCQNCGNRFTVDQVEIESGGCNPYPIFSENKTVTEDSIQITYDFLKESTAIFAEWKS